jgi:putative DNA primase/helicase
MSAVITAVEMDRKPAAVAGPIDVFIDDRSSKRVELVRGDAITPTRITWLWPGHLAKGKLHILAGAPGTGKTTLALAFAAAITSNGNMPCGSRAPRGSVLIWSGEDDPADTLVPRLRAAGADMTKVFFVGAVREEGDSRFFNPATDIDLLMAEAARINDIALVIADPVVSAVSGDSHKNSEVRRALQPLVDLGSTTGAAILGISHFSKGTGDRDPLERVSGSIAFGALARIVMVTAKNNGGQRIVARAKSNIGPDGGGFQYELEMVDADGIEASRVVWGARIDGSARELVGMCASDEVSSQTDEVEQFLTDALADGEVSAADIKQEAGRLGFSEKTLRRACQRLRVKTRKSSFKDGWFWRLPPQGDHEGVQDAYAGNGSSSASSGHLRAEVLEVIEL